MADLWLVKVKRTGYESILDSGTREQCELVRDGLNVAFQTDEYFIERWEDQL